MRHSAACRTLHPPQAVKCRYTSHRIEAQQTPAHHGGTKFLTLFEEIMSKSTFFNDLQSKIGQVFENSPAKDLEKNVKAMLSQGFSRLDLVTREEFDVQTQVLAKTRAKVDALEARLAELEALARDRQPGA
jgi:BMFP domain-containing protein YqiC